MDSIGGIDWSLRAPEAVRAELARRYPSKLPESIEVAVPFVVREIECAWRCYGQGAAAAIFDIVRVLSEIAMPLPDDVRDEVERLALLALSGEGDGRGRGAAPPLMAHQRALRKRWRYSWVAWVRLNDRMNHAEVEAMEDWRNAGMIDREIWEADRASRSKMSDEVTRACQIAKEHTKETTTQWRAYYDDYRELHRAMEHRMHFPGIFYIPSEETCAEMGWKFANDMAPGFAFRDAPLFIVS